LNFCKNNQKILILVDFFEFFEYNIMVEKSSKQF